MGNLISVQSSQIEELKCRVISGGDRRRLPGWLGYAGALHPLQPSQPPMSTSMWSQAGADLARQAWQRNVGATMLERCSSADIHAAFRIDSWTQRICVGDVKKHLAGSRPSS
jgi:hypothetical protein